MVLLRKLDRAVFDHGYYPRRLDTLIGDARNLLDVGCGDGSPAQLAGRRLSEAVGVDGDEQGLLLALKTGGYSSVRKMDIRQIAEVFGPGAFDTVVCTDVIEHLSKDEGLALLNAMECVARKRVIVATPNGFVPQCDPDQPLQNHLSGWRVWDFEDRGYTVEGFGGWRPLKGHYALPRFKPRWLWWRLSLLTEKLLARFPGHSFHLLAWKEVAK